MDGETCATKLSCPQTTDQKERLSDVLSGTEELINNVIGRLSIVLSNPSPPQTDGEDKPESELVPLAHEIRVQRRRLENCNKSLNDLLRRIEL